MISLTKSPDRDFTVLNLTDPQLSDSEWKPGEKNREILVRTVTALAEKTQPDLITVSGDLAWAGHYEAYACLADFLESFGVPWAPVMGNHDNQGGPEAVDRAVAILTARSHCLWENGDPALGKGNYVIAVEQEGRPIHGILMMDSHDRKPWTDEKGETVSQWADLDPAQLAWYEETVGGLQARGVRETTLILHIPLYTYREAFRAAWKAEIDPHSVSPEESDRGLCWNDGYRDSVGVFYEGVGSYPADNGFFDRITALGSTKTVLAGHDHVNDFMIRYRGVRLIYALKTGAGCYWDPRLNGGTVLKISARGEASAVQCFIREET